MLRAIVRPDQRLHGSPAEPLLTDLGHGIRGDIEWGLRVPRYLSLSGGGAGRPGDAEPPGRLDWAEAPLAGDLDPRRLPSVAWWWQDLSL